MPPAASAPPASRLTLVLVFSDDAPRLLEAIGRALALGNAPPVLVVDNGSSGERSREAKERYPQVKLVRLPFDAGAAAWNVGVERTETPYVAICDAATVWADDALATAVQLLDFYPRIAALSARVLHSAEGPEDATSARLGRTPLRSRGVPGRELLGLTPRAAVLRRAAFLDQGGFEPRLHRGGDELLAYDLAAAGWSLVYAPSVVAYRPDRPSDPRDARELRARDALLTAWLRRPLPSAIRRTLSVLASGGAWGALRSVLCDATWVARNRRVVPAPLEARCRRLDAAA